MRLDVRIVRDYEDHKANLAASILVMQRSVAFANAAAANGKMMRALTARQKRGELYYRERMEALTEPQV